MQNWATLQTAKFMKDNTAQMLQMADPMPIPRPSHNW